MGLLCLVWCALGVLCEAACSDLVRRVAGAAADCAESMGRGNPPDSPHNKPCAAHEIKWEEGPLGSSLGHLLWVAGLQGVTYGSP